MRPIWTLPQSFLDGRSFLVYVVTPTYGYRTRKRVIWNGTHFVGKYTNVVYHPYAYTV